MDEGWHLVKKAGLRFYQYLPGSGVSLMFTTRRANDASPDHDLDIGQRLSRLGKDYSLVTMEQTHSDKVVMVTEPGQVKADACFTLGKDLALAVRAADCVPVFLWGDDLIGVIHAGWKGTLAKIALRFTEKVQALADIPPHQLSYSLGPSVGPCCYKVGKEILTAFAKTWPNARDFFKPTPKGLYLDLRFANRFLLNSAGAGERASLDLCTHCNPGSFFSFRREPNRGRNWGIITRTRNPGL